MSEHEVNTAAHHSSYPMGNKHHGTPERPNWGTFCVKCKDSWPCDVSLLAARLADAEARAEAAEADALEEAAGFLWRVFLLMPNTPSPLSDEIQRKHNDFRARAEALRGDQ